jgi:hypothetical protein
MHRRRAAALAITTWSIVLPLAGCYTYVPVAPRVTPPLGESTIVLTATGMRTVQQRLGENVRTLDGPIQRVTADSIELTVTEVGTTTRERFPQNGLPLTIARADVEQVQTRTHVPKRTWTLVGVVAAVLAVALGAGTIASASSSGPGGGGIQP